MLPFSSERLTTKGKVQKDIFYYNLKSFIPEVYIFSKTIHDDLKNYLGIQFEIKQRLKFSEAVDNQGHSRFYDQNKITRIELLYDFYVEYVLRTMQLLYYEQFDEKFIFNISTEIIKDIQAQFTDDGTAKNQVQQVFRDGEQDETITSKFSDKFGKTEADSMQRNLEGDYQIVLNKLQKNVSQLKL